jgi:hypothetical protein
MLKVPVIEHLLGSDRPGGAAVPIKVGWKPATAPRASAQRSASVSAALGQPWTMQCDRPRLPTMAAECVEQHSVAAADKDAEGQCR